MKRATEKWARVDGGQWDSVEPSAIPKNGWARLVNWLTVNARLVRRGGTNPLSLGTAALPSISGVIPVSDLLYAPLGAAEWCLVAASKVGTFAIMKSDRLWHGVVPALSGAVIPTDDMPWLMKQRNGVVYAIRRNSGTMKRIDGAAVTGAGRPTPIYAPTLASTPTTGGSLVDGVYQIGFNYYDSVTGQDGNGSPVLTVTLSGGGSTQAINISGITDWPESYRVTHKRVWMSRVDGAIKYLSGSIAGNGTGTNTFAITAEPVSTETLPTRNAPPEDGATWFELWKDRGWLTNGEWVRYTDFGKPECYSAIQDVSYNPKDGDTVTTLYGWGDVLVVAKKRAMVLLTGVDRSSFENALWTEMVGCVAPHSMKDCEGLLIWLGEDGVYSAEGPLGTPRKVSDLTVSAALEEMALATRDTAVGEVIPQLGLYVLVFKATDGTFRGLAYNWTSKAWSELTWPINVNFLTSGYTEAGATTTLACSDTDAIVHTLLEGGDDDGAAVAAVAVSRAIQGEDGNRIAVKGLRLLMSDTRYPVGLVVYNDGDIATAVASRSVRPIGDRGWSQFDLSSGRAPAGQVQVGITYTGKDEVWIADIMVDVLETSLRRRSLPNA